MHTYKYISLSPRPRRRARPPADPIRWEHILLLLLLLLLLLMITIIVIIMIMTIIMMMMIIIIITSPPDIPRSLGGRPAASASPRLSYDDDVKQ